ncbi:phosphoribosylformylglycinamidine synthase [Oceanirhabdus sp. W0125-5]|uniref:phosphoribosylformylglycinamidine synthase n=1 Tax=Oceanirhabdus sp. W0125-5 TaxID=2999116 RepID=UPI0022F34049|nr:phosphoribosylformylglycinamidine synthase [Oceanirhabdus sp. W0125-5]WBW95734.1 phosphoribosylformylglycinamidine synthase [Oceanirhabdus sp. W0125-5]
MLNKGKEVFIEKKNGFNNESVILKEQLKEVFNIELSDVRIMNRYYIKGINDEEFELVSKTLIGEKNIEKIQEELGDIQGYTTIHVAYLKGQFDQRADSAEQCIRLLYPEREPEVECSKVYFLKGEIEESEFEKIKEFLINKVDSHEIPLGELNIQVKENIQVDDVKVIDGFINMDNTQIQSFIQDMGLSMTKRDVKHIVEYFNSIDRNPTVTEIKVLDTYWSDHCRHTTFNTLINNIEIEDGLYSGIIKDTLNEYVKVREGVYGDKERGITLMDLAVIGMKEMKRRGKLDDLDISEEINACSINIVVDNNGEDEEWLLMFKNETHNHPTEIEPFGGASTCLGGAIRDPLSGRSYVYAAMRVTGSGDPRESIESTLKGKLPQIKITREAARGYSSYGNQIGLTTGLVHEIYHEGYKAKRMEVGAVVGAVPKEYVRRETPVEGDRIILIGGRTGRDGIGGASGSSKVHDEKSIDECGAEVQKGNPPTERKIQRLFRDERVLKLIKRCNDFGAGGVSVAVGEIADGLIIDLDKVRKKYDGLDGTELAISESQERMAVAVSACDVEKFIELADEENLEAYEIAEVTEERKLIMKWRGKNIVDIHRDFLDTNGASNETDVFIEMPAEFEQQQNSDVNTNSLCRFESHVKDINRCSQQGLIEMFDNSIGAGTVLMPFGGKFEKTPIQTMVHKIPVKGGETSTVSAMSFGFNVGLSEWSPFHGGIFAVLECLSKLVASGVDYKDVRFSFQEYFERLGEDKKKWGKPFAALLGAFKSQLEFETPAIGGKDSMSGTFKDIHVPPTLVAFGVGTGHVDNIISPEFKGVGSQVILFKIPVNEQYMPDFNKAKEVYSKINSLIKEGKIDSAYALSGDTLESSLSKMTFGNRIGIKLNKEEYSKLMQEKLNGSIICEIPEEYSKEIELLLSEGNVIQLGATSREYSIYLEEEVVKGEELQKEWEQPLKPIFSVEPKESEVDLSILESKFKKEIYVSDRESRKPKILIPVFPGTNCEYDSKAAFDKAGGDAKLLVFKNLTEQHIRESIEKLREEINRSNIIMLPGGFSAGDEPDGSGKFISAIFRNPVIKEGVMELLYKRDGLMLGICNGFQALVKLGLVPFGEIKEVDDNSPTLTYNNSGKHIAKMVKTKIISNKSPWLSGVNVGDIHTIPISHGEGRFVANEAVLKSLIENDQIATAYHGSNPNGSSLGIEGVTSLDGRVFGKMGHSERIGKGLYKNIHGQMDQKIFKSGVEYFK